MLNRSTEFFSLDDLLYATYRDILKNGKKINSKRGGDKELKELINYSATLTNPRIRTSMSLHRKLVQSKFAEFAWYLSKDDDIDYITPYISKYNREEQENNKILGGYGSKIFGSENKQISQYERVIEQISKRKSTKQAYLAISEKENYKFRDEKYKSPPCTIGLHFYVRDSKLSLTCYMRSNDAYYGLPHDLFCFTMLQEMISCRINIPMGTYTHNVTSMHIYNQHFNKVKKYLSEGKQEPIEMPGIEKCNSKTLNLVSKEFNVSVLESEFDSLDNYWKDYVLFANKHSNDSIEPKFWLNKFNNKEMRRIALNSICK